MKKTLALSLVLTTACATVRNGDDAAESVGQLVAERRYEEAVSLAAERLSENPDDEGLQAEHRIATAALMMDRGRTVFYDGKLDEAAVFFDEAYATAPDAPQTRAWMLKIHDEIADAKLTEAIRFHALDELEDAAAAYEEVLANRPDDLRAQEGLGRALLQINYRQGQGSEYYNQGVRDLNEYYLHEARSKFSYTGLYWGDDKKVDRRSGQVDRLLADQRATMAAHFESTEQYAAAKNEFRLALLLVPGHTEARSGFQRCKREADAAEKLRDAEMLIRKRQFAGAQAAIDEGRGLTDLQGPRFDAMADLLEAGRFEAKYEQAVSLESDYQFEAAVATYDELLAEAQYYDDAIARRDTLLDFIAHAKDLYAEALGTTDAVEQLAIYEQIELVWPEYRDIQDRIERLRAELGITADD